MAFGMSCSLARLLKPFACRVCPPPLRLTDARRFALLCGTAAGIHALHSSPHPILHGDVKPGNVLVMEDWTAKVADFGLAASSALATVASTGACSNGGTRAYAAPELLKPLVVDSDDDGGDQDDDGGDGGGAHWIATDIYSFGVLAWETVTAGVPWQEVAAKYRMNAPLRIAKKVVNGQRPDIAAVDRRRQRPDERYGAGGACRPNT